MRILPLLLCCGCLSPGESGNLVPKTVVEDPELPAIAIADTHLHAEAFGDPAAPLVIALHGGPGVDYRSMLPLAALADDGYRVVFWDQRSTGLSERHAAETIDLDLYIEDLRLVIEHYTVVPDQPVLFIGHSWGAMYATAFINTHGDYGGRIQGAVLSDPGAFTDKQLRAFIDRFVKSVDFFGEQINDAMWAAQFVSPNDHARADYLAGLMAIRGVPAEHHDPNNPTPFWRFGAIVHDRMLEIGDTVGFDWTTNLAAYQHPVLFLRSDIDEAAPLEQQQELASYYPHATIETIPGSHHEMIWENAQQYMDGVRSYMHAIAFTGGAR